MDVIETNTTSNSTNDAKRQLIDELSNDHSSINILRIRNLCRDHPGIISTTGLRLRIWSLLLLGHEDISNDQATFIPTTEKCDEQQVLEADVRRTRADLEEFKTSLWRKTITEILQTFCVTHDVQYKQGMNEIIAPFMYINPPPNDTKVTYNLFEAFLFRYVERYFCVDSSHFLYKAFRLFHLLLLYHDPQLALHLQNQEFPPELYAPSWFLTVYARALPIPLVLRIWDMLISVDDPAFIFFLGLCLIRGKRNDILLKDTDQIPEIMTKILFEGEDDIEKILSEALSLYRITPRCVLRNIRLCNVFSSELTPLPRLFKDRNSFSFSFLKSKMNKNDEIMAIQSVRSNLMISASELVDYLSQNIQKIIIIDIRPLDDNNNSGGGTIPKAIIMDPEFITDKNNSNFDIWVQHFDASRDFECLYVIIDLLPADVEASNAVWKRLIFGENYDDADVNLLSPFRNFFKKKQSSSNTSSYDHNNNIFRDLQSPFSKLEEKAIKEDLCRPAVKLASELKKNTFPHVLLLDGGYKALIDELLSKKGKVDPYIDDFNLDKWNTFIETTGRTPTAEVINIPVTKQKKDDDNDTHKPKELSPLEIAQIALDVAVKKDHVFMQSFLREKIARLEAVAHAEKLCNDFSPELDNLLFRA